MSDETIKPEERDNHRAAFERWKVSLGIGGTKTDPEWDDGWKGALADIYIRRMPDQPIRWAEFVNGSFSKPFYCIEVACRKPFMAGPHDPSNHLCPDCAGKATQSP